ncbi:MAG: exosortase/archaeosortase family protein [Synergistaceae bacterium]|nr:exosortase/archaeosortase family protein [Synergistaceae bacterium]
MLLARPPMWRWLWARWFGTGGEFYSGVLFLATLIGITVYFVRDRERGDFAPDTISLLIALSFLAAGAAAYPFIPGLVSAGLFVSAIYWSVRSVLRPQDRGASFALWPLMLLGLPHGPSLQFVLGYPLRVSAARLAALALPGDVRAVGCGLGDGTIEVFVDAPCAGAGMLSGLLILAAGAAIIFRLNWRKTLIMLFAGVLCALSANASRAALLYAGYAGMLNFQFQRFESTTGLFCYTASAILLTALAFFLAKSMETLSMDETERKTSILSKKRTSAIALLYIAICSSVALASAIPSGRHAPERIQDISVTWPSSWGGRTLIPASPDPETEKFWRDFGAYREFKMINGDTADGWFPKYDRIVFRYVDKATRLLHPAEDCFRGAGYEIEYQPVQIDEAGREWSGFVCEKSGVRQNVLQCVISVPNGDLREVENDLTARTWADVSSWYWHAALPGGDKSAALAITYIF